MKGGNFFLSMFNIRFVSTYLILFLKTLKTDAQKHKINKRLSSGGKPSTMVTAGVLMKPHLSFSSTQTNSRHSNIVFF